MNVGQLSGDGPAPTVIRPLGDGSIVYQTYAGNSDRPAFANRAGRGALVRGDTRRVSTDTIAHYLPLLSRELLPARGPPKVLVATVQALPAIAYAADGMSFVVIEQPSVVSTSSELAVLRRTVAGDTLFRRTVSMPREIFADRQKQAFADRADNASSSDERAMIFGMLKPIQYLPAITKALLSTDGSIWINRFSNDSVGSWAILDARGRWVAQLSTPLRFQLFAVSKELAWGVQYNSDGLPELRRFKIRRGR
ncbi:MAG: hypothetical protein IT353_01145 [Gemmatimonadaceae bacterium]|nr:hypothetical protein [Gemmatimonadaceae bacterium]